MNPEKNNDDFIASEYTTEMEELIKSSTICAMTAGNSGDFDIAFLNMELALWITRSFGNKCLEATLLNNLGLLYTMQGAWDRAMLTFEHSLKLASGPCKTSDKFIGILQNNIACLFDPTLITPGKPENH